MLRRQQSSLSGNFGRRLISSSVGRQTNQVSLPKLRLQALQSLRRRFQSTFWIRAFNRSGYREVLPHLHDPVSAARCRGKLVRGLPLPSRSHSSAPSQRTPAARSCSSLGCLSPAHAVVSSPHCLHPYSSVTVSVSNMSAQSLVRILFFLTCCVACFVYGHITYIEVKYPLKVSLIFDQRASRHVRLLRMKKSN